MSIINISKIIDYILQYPNNTLSHKEVSQKVTELYEEYIKFTALIKITNSESYINRDDLDIDENISEIISIVIEELHSTKMKIGN